MSSNPRLSPRDFAAKIRSKYPGKYDDMDDLELSRRIVSKHPDYVDMVGLPAFKDAYDDLRFTFKKKWGRDIRETGDDTPQHRSGNKVGRARDLGTHDLEPDQLDYLRTEARRRGFNIHDFSHLTGPTVLPSGMRVSGPHIHIEYPEGVGGWTPEMQATVPVAQRSTRRPSPGYRPPRTNEEATARMAREHGPQDAGAVNPAITLGLARPPATVRKDDPLGYHTDPLKFYSGQKPNQPFAETGRSMRRPRNPNRQTPIAPTDVEATRREMTMDPSRRGYQSDDAVAEVIHRLRGEPTEQRPVGEDIGGVTGPGPTPDEQIYLNSLAKLSPEEKEATARRITRERQLGRWEKEILVPKGLSTLERGTALAIGGPAGGMLAESLQGLGVPVGEHLTNIGGSTVSGAGSTLTGVGVLANYATPNQDSISMLVKRSLGGAMKGVGGAVTSEMELQQKLRGGEGVISDVEKGVAGSVPLMAAAAGAGMVGGPALSTAMVGAMGAAQTTGGMYEEAKQYGLSDEDANRAALLGVPIGLTEMWGIGSIPGKAMRHVMARQFVEAVLKEAGEEFTQEAVQQALQNLSAQGMYDPHRGTFQDVGYNAVIGAISGGVFGAAFHKAGGHEAEHPSPKVRLAPHGQPVDVPEGMARTRIAQLGTVIHPREMPHSEIRAAHREGRLQGMLDDAPAQRMRVVPGERPPQADQPVSRRDAPTRYAADMPAPGGFVEDATHAPLQRATNVGAPSGFVDATGNIPDTGPRGDVSDQFVARDASGVEVWRGSAEDAADAISQAGPLARSAVQLPEQSERDIAARGTEDFHAEVDRMASTLPKFEERAAQLREATAHGETTQSGQVAGHPPVDAPPEYNTILQDAQRGRKYNHARFGEVTESTDQTGVPTGYKRVIDSSGVEHTVKPQHRNQLMIPARDEIPQEAYSEATAAHRRLLERDFSPDAVETFRQTSARIGLPQGRIDELIHEARTSTRGLPPASQATSTTKVTVESVGRGTRELPPAPPTTAPKAVHDAYARLKRNVELGGRTDDPDVIQRYRADSAGEPTVSSGLDPERAFKAVTVLGYDTYHDVKDFAKWSAAIVKKFGDSVKPILQEVWDTVRGHHATATASPSENHVAEITRDHPQAPSRSDVFWDRKRYGIVDKDGNLVSTGWDLAETPEAAANQLERPPMSIKDLNEGRLPTGNQELPEGFKLIENDHGEYGKTYDIRNAKTNEILTAGDNTSESAIEAFNRHYDENGNPRQDHGADLAKQKKAREHLDKHGWQIIDPDGIVQFEDFDTNEEAVQFIKEHGEEFGITRNWTVGHGHPIETSEDLSTDEEAFAREQMTAQNVRLGGRVDDPPAIMKLRIEASGGIYIGLGADPVRALRSATLFGYDTYRDVKDFAGWSTRMAAKFGKQIKPLLRDLWTHVTAFGDTRKPLYSSLDLAVRQKMKGPMSVSDFSKMLKSEGITDDELRWTGLSDFLASRNADDTVSPAEIAQATRPVTVEEVVKGAPATGATNEAINSWDEERRRLDHNVYSFFSDLKEVDFPSEEKVVFIENMRSAGAEGNYMDLNDPINNDTIPHTMAQYFASNTQTLDALKNLVNAYTDHMVDDPRSIDDETSTRYDEDSYRLSGESSGYRELLLALPRVPAVPLTELPEGYKLKTLRSRGEPQRFVVLAPDGRQFTPLADRYISRELATNTALGMLNRNLPSVKGYNSPHWDEPNVVVHARYDTRELADGRKVFYIDEVQSDWHQSARKKGRADNSKPLSQVDKQRYEELANMGYEERQEAGVQDEFENLINRTSGGGTGEIGGVSPAPFEKDWHELAFKRLVQHAVEQGHDTVAWSTGAVQLGRWGTEKLSWERNEDGLWVVRGLEHVSTDFDTQTENEYPYNATATVGTKQHLWSVVNTALRREQPEYSKLNWAKRIDSITDKMWSRMQTEDTGSVQPRREGMEGFYDRMLTGYAAKFAKKFNSSVEPLSLDTKADYYDPHSRTRLPAGYEIEIDEDENGKETYSVVDSTSGDEVLFGEPTRHDAIESFWLDRSKIPVPVTLHSMAVTPEMQSSIPLEGLPVSGSEPKFISESRTRLHDMAKNLELGGHSDDPDVIVRFRRESATGGKLTMGADPVDGMKKLMVLGYDTYRGAKSFAEWSTAMVGKLGKQVKPLLRDAWLHVTAFHAHHGGFYQPLEVTLASSPNVPWDRSGRIPTDALQKALASQGHSAEELTWTRFDKFLATAGDTVGRQDALDFIKENKIRLVETHFGAGAKYEAATNVLREFLGRYMHADDVTGTLEELEDDPDDPIGTLQEGVRMTPVAERRYRSLVRERVVARRDTGQPTINTSIPRPLVDRLHTAGFEVETYENGQLTFIDTYARDNPDEVDEDQSTEYHGENDLRDLDEWNPQAAAAARAILTVWNQRNPPTGATKFTQWTTPGGTNHRELTLSLPQETRTIGIPKYDVREHLGEGARPGVESYAVFIGDQRVSGYGLTREAAQTLANNWTAQGPATVKTAAAYVVSTAHKYKNQGADVNRIALLRVDDRVLPGEKRGLHLDEFQDDLQNEIQAAKADLAKVRARAKEQGDAIDAKTYVDMDPGPYRDKIQKEVASAEKKVRDLEAKLPFRGKSHELVFKKALQYAVENNYDALTWATGGQVADRYSLRKAFDELRVARAEDGTYVLKGFKKSEIGAMVEVVSKSAVDEGKLSHYVGQAMADTIVADMHDQVTPTGDTDFNNWEFYRGENLAIGGEGKLKLYDEIAVNFMKKYVAKWGASVGITSITAHPQVSKLFIEELQPDAWFILDGAANDAVREGPLSEEDAQKQLDELKNGTEVHSVEVTDAMRKALLTEGQPVMGSEPRWVAEARTRLHRALSGIQLSANPVDLLKDMLIVTGYDIYQGLAAASRTLTKWSAEVRKTFPEASEEDMKDAWEQIAVVPPEGSPEAPSAPEGQHVLGQPVATREERERSLPKTLRAAGLEEGDDLAYEQTSLLEGVAEGKQNIIDKGIDGAINHVLFVRPGIDWASTAYAVMQSLRDQEQSLRDEGRDEEAGHVALKRSQFVGDFAERATELGQAISGIRAIEEFAPDRAVYAANKASQKGRGRPLTGVESKRIETHAAEMKASADRIRDLERRLKAKYTREDKVPPPSGYRGALKERAKSAFTALKAKVGSLDFGYLRTGKEHPAERGAVKNPFGNALPGDAELLAQYGSANIEGRTTEEFDAHMVDSFGEEVRPYLDAVRRRAFEIRKEARLAEVQDTTTPADRRTTVIQEMLAEAAEARKKQQEADRAWREFGRSRPPTVPTPSQGATVAAGATREQRRQARIDAKQARSEERVRLRSAAEQARQARDNASDAYQEASVAGKKAWRQSIKEQRTARKQATLWDRPLRDAAASARERLVGVTGYTEADQPDLVDVAAGMLLPDLQFSVTNKAGKIIWRGTATDPQDAILRAGPRGVTATQLVGLKSIRPLQASALYARLKSEFPGLVNKGNQRRIYKQAYQRVIDALSASRVAAQEQAANTAAGQLFREQGIDIDAQEYLIQRAEEQRKRNDARRDLAREFDRVSRTPLKRFLHEIQSVPRALQSSIDAPIGRQGLFYSITHPILMTKYVIPATWRGYTSLRRGTYSQRVSELEQHPDFKLAMRAGVDWTLLASEADSGKLGGGSVHVEEAFQSSYAERLWHTRLSEQGFNLGMNAQRLSTFSRYADYGRSKGYTWETNPEFFQQAARRVNIFSGRGSLNQKAQEIVSSANWLLYSARLQVSRAQMVADMLNPVNYTPWSKEDPAMRRIRAGEALRLAVGLSLLYGTARMLGATVGHDPDDPDFGKVVVGNTRYDLTAGESVYFRFIYKMVKAAGHRAEGETKDDKVGNEIWRSLQKKLAPWPGTVISLLEGRDVVNKPVNLGFHSLKQVHKENAIAKMLEPLIIGDFVDAIAEEGWVGVAKTAPGLTGLGVQTYEPKAPRAGKTGFEYKAPVAKDQYKYKYKSK